MRIRSVILLLLCPVFGLSAKSIECSDPKTPLSIAAAEGNLDSIREILGAGGDANEIDVSGRTALMFASWLLHGPAVEALLSGGANINQRDGSGQTALIYAMAIGPMRVCGPYSGEFSDEARYETVVLLIQAGADVNVASLYGVTALYQAVLSGFTQIARILIDAGADVDAQSVNGWSPLMKASYDQKIDTVQLLLEAGANVNAQNDTDVCRIYGKLRNCSATAGLWGRARREESRWSHGPKNCS